MDDQWLRDVISFGGTQCLSVQYILVDIFFLMKFLQYISEAI